MKRQKSDGVYFFWSAAMLVSVVLAVFALMFASCSGGGEKKTKDSESPESEAVLSERSTPVSADVTGQAAVPPGGGGTEPPQASEPVAQTGAELVETEDMGQEYIDKMYFLGDSTTHGLASYGIIPEARVWTPLNGTLSIFRWNVDQINLPDDGTTMFMNDALALKKPEYLLITLGVNGVGVLEEADFKNYYSQMVDALKEASPDTRIILNSIYPVGREYAEESITNEKIDAANGWIKQIAEEKGVKYLNSSSVLKDEQGFLKEGYDNGDDLHPNADTYNIIINYVRTHGYPDAEFSPAV